MYRHLQATKRVGGKVRRYKNLAAFAKECPTRGYNGNICTVINVRCTKDGGGLATVKSAHMGPENIYHKGGKPSGTWLLHFADCGIMKGFLQKRAGVSKSGILQGASRGRRKRRLTAAQIRDKLACKIFGGKACR